VTTVKGDGVLGSSVPRKEDLRLLTGRGRYVSDLTLPGMLHAAFVRSSFAHARVNGVEATAALERPGVVAVLAGDDPKVAGIRITARSEVPGYVETSQPLLAWPKVRYAGEAVAVVVAEDRATAVDAAELVEVDYEPLPVVVDPVAAAKPGCEAVVHEAAPDNVYLRRRFEAPATLGKINGEGTALAPEGECAGGLKSFFWADDNETDDHALRRGTIPCGDFF